MCFDSLDESAAVDEPVYDSVPILLYPLVWVKVRPQRALDVFKCKPISQDFFGDVLINPI